MDADRPVLAGGGTFSMKPMTAAAGLASFEVLEREPVYEHTENQSERIRTELGARFEELGVHSTALGTSSLFAHPESSLTSVGAVETGTDRDALREFHHRLFDRGYYFLPGHVGAVSYQTTEAQVDRFIDDAEAVAGEMQAEGRL